MTTDTNEHQQAAESAEEAALRMDPSMRPPMPPGPVLGLQHEPMTRHSQ